MNNEEKILSILETLVTKFDKLEAGQSKLEADIYGLKQGQNAIREDIQELKVLSKATFDEIERLDRRADKIEFAK